MTRSTLEAPVEGRDVRLTIDRDIQWAAQKAITRPGAGPPGRAAATSSCMDTRTGQILAMANAPELDPNELVEGPRQGLGQPGGRRRVRAGQHQQGHHRGGGPGGGSRAARHPVHGPRPGQVRGPGLRTTPTRTPSSALTFTGILAKSSNIGTILAARQARRPEARPVLYDDAAALRVRRQARRRPPRRGARAPARLEDLVGQPALHDPLRPGPVAERAADGHRLPDHRQRRRPGRPADRAPAPPTSTATFTPPPPGKQTRVVSEQYRQELATMLEAVVSEEGTGQARRRSPATGSRARPAPPSGSTPSCGRYRGYTASFVGLRAGGQPAAGRRWPCSEPARRATSAARSRPRSSSRS